MTGEEIMKFFDNQVDTRAFAMYIRRYNHTVAIKELTRINNNSEVMQLDEIINGIYWTNEFAELIDPYLDKE